jgi:hypothetical protein
MTLYLTAQSAQGIDFEINGLQTRSSVLSTPVFRFWQNGGLMLVFTAFGWFLAVVMRGRGYRLRRVAALFFAIAAMLGGMLIVIVLRS